LNKKYNKIQEEKNKIVENADLFIYKINFLDDNGKFNPKIVEVNDVMQRLSGYSKEEFLSLNPLENLLATKSDRDKFINRMPKVLNGEKVSKNVDYQIKCKNGEIKWASIQIMDVLTDNQGKKIGVSVLGSDINNRKYEEKKAQDLQKQLYQAQKMEAIGTLAGGIAHDFNNILTVINGNTELLMKTIPKDSYQIKSLNRISRAGTRAKNLVKQILSFSRKSENQKKNIKPDLIVKECITLLSSSLKASINIKYHSNYADEQITINANEDQIHQVIMNLGINASHAFNGNKNANLEFKLKKLYLNGCHAKMMGIEGGKYLKLSVKDDGIGMDEKTQKKIFDPFFTTKDKYLGTGLGLSVVYRIIKDHSGGIYVKSKINKGTTFEVYLPISNFEYKKKVVSNQVIKKQYGNLLYIDDQPELLDVGKMMFERIGFHVDIEQSGTNAFNAYLKNPTKYDIILTDYDMPEMNGLEFSNKVFQFNSNANIILCTGDITPVREKANKIGIKYFLDKPYNLKKVSDVVNNIYNNQKEKIYQNI
ncbi:response regulator, partial [Candidatus Woesearchaeota archaeon]|nr:response regulator [Candidatus Woesearchaeota archaeon]